MTQADCVYITPPTNTPVDTTRRHFLLAVAGGSAAMLAATIAEPAATALASQLDPVFSLIEAHRGASARHGVALKEQARLEQLGDPEASKVADEPCHADVRTWRTLVSTAPLTFAGLRAWASYLDEVRGVEEWMFRTESEGRTLRL
jgi:hypothetical protein